MTSLVTCSGPWLSWYVPAGIWIVSGPGVSPDDTIACRIEQLVGEQKPVASVVVSTTNGSAAAGAAKASTTETVVARNPFQRIFGSIASVSRCTSCPCAG